MSSRSSLILVLLFSAGTAAARVQVPSRTELKADIIRLEEKLDALRAAPAGSPEMAARLEALEKEVAALKAAAGAASPTPATDHSAESAKLEELETELQELSEDVARKGDLKKYVRKPDEKEFKARNAQELEVRGAFTDLREDEIARTGASLGMLAQNPMLSARSRAILAGVAALSDQLVENDTRFRPRMMFRMYWEANRFLSDDSYLFASAEPELILFVYDQDIDRALIPQDVSGSFDRLSVVFKKAAAGVQLGRFGLQAGVLQFTYGAGFFFNPTNVFTPKNPLDPKREVYGIPAAKMDLTFVQSESVTFTGQLAASGRMIRNDILDVRSDALQTTGMAMFRLDTKPLSLTAIGIGQAPDDLGQDGSLSFGGILSANPFGLTASVEALWKESPFEDDVYKPDLVASIQGFTPKIGYNGTTYILEYLFNGEMPTSSAEAANDVARAILKGAGFLTIDRLTRPLGRRNYATLYLEPSLTERLKINVAGLVGFDEAVGAILRGGLDYSLYNFTIHAFGGVLVGAENSEFQGHFFQSFAELAVFASF